MKRILCTLLCFVFVFTSLSAVNAEDGEDFVNENVIVNGDFEGSSTISGNYAKYIPDCADKSSPWFPLNADFRKVSIGEEPESGGNHVLILDHVTQNWLGVVQLLPINRKATGVYEIKFRAKNAGPGARGNVRCRVSFVLNKSGSYTRDTNSAYRTVAFGAEQESPTTFILEDNEWHDISFNVDLMARSGGVYRDMIDEVAAVQIELYQDFDGKSNLAAAQAAGSDLTETVLYIDDVEVVPPEPLMVTSVGDGDMQNVKCDSAYIPVSFNYTQGIREDSLENISITDKKGNSPEYSVAAEDGGIAGISFLSLEPDTEYTVNIDKLISDTPVFDPSKNPGVYNSEKRYVSMINPYSFTFKTEKRLVVEGLSYSDSDKTVKASVKLNDSVAGEDIVLAAFKEKNGIILSDVYYMPLSLSPGDEKDVTWENVSLGSEGDFRLVITKGFGGAVSEEEEGLSVLTVDLSAENETLTVSGNVREKYFGKTVTAEILLPDDSGNAQDSSSINTLEPGAAEKMFLAIAECVSDENDGSFYAEPVKISQSGTYRVVAKVDGVVFASQEKYFSSKADNEMFLKSVNSVEGTDTQKADALFEILEKENTEQKIRYESKYYNMLSDYDKKLVCENLLNGIPYDIDGFVNAFTGNTVFQAAVKSESADEILFLISGSYDSLGKDYIKNLFELDKLYSLSVYKDFEGFSSDEQRAVVNDYISSVQKYNRNVNCAEEFRDAFGIAVINRLIAETSLHKDVSAILNNHTDILDNLNIKAYNELGLNQASVNSNIKNNPKNTVEEFEKYVNGLISSSANGSSSSSSNGSSSSSSGGGGGNNISSGGKSYTADIPINNSVTSEPLKKPFNDIDDFVWAQNAINTLSERGIISGNGNGSFNPGDPVTREEFVKMVVSAAGIQPSGTQSYNFADVPEESWYAQYVAAAYENGIAKGVGNDLFGVGMYITRQDMFVMSSYLLNSVPAAISGTELDNFSDGANVADYAVKCTEKLLKLGAVSGNGEGRLNPGSNTTRAEAAVVIYNILRLGGKL